MARSLTVKHEEKPGTSSLFNSFLLLALGWMIAGAVLASMANAASPDPAATVGAVAAE